MLRRLTPLEIDAYGDLADRRRAARMRVLAFPLPGSFVGLTLGRLVLLSPGHDVADGASALLAHEMVHVRQWGELGARRFLTAYVGSWLRNLRAGHSLMEAYRQIPLEAEARGEARRWRAERLAAAASFDASEV